MQRICRLSQIAKGTALYLYGSGAFAKQVCRKLQTLGKGITILGFIDSFQSGEWEGFTIHEFGPEFVRNQYRESDPIIVASLYYEEISVRLENAGIQNFRILDPSVLAPKLSWVKRVRGNARQTASKFQFRYERSLAPFIARKLYYIYIPIYWLLKRFRYRFICNVAHGTGHITRDLDHFFLSFEENPSLHHYRWVWITPRHEAYRSYVELFRNHFYFARSSNLLYNLVAPVLMRFADISIDAGSAQIKWQLDINKQIHPPFPEQTALNLLPLEDVTHQWQESYKLHQRHPSSFPLKRANWGERNRTAGFLDKDRKVALIHIKDRVANACAKATDPQTYMPALRYLDENGYQLVFVGREKMPEIFRNALEIHDYASSAQATLANDLYLFSIADIAIVSGGIACLASAMGTPFVYVNSWHIAKFWWPRLNVVVPTLLEENGVMIHARQQQRLHDDLKESQTFRHLNYSPLNASGADILEGIHELEQLRENYTPETELQLSAKSIFKEDLVTYSSGRFSHSFLRKHRSVFSEDKTTNQDLG